MGIDPRNSHGNRPTIATFEQSRQASTTALMMRTRLPELERAKGIAILLVVFGHVVARDAPAGNEWYVLAKHAVYSFHMAFFMFLSGLVFFARRKNVASIWDFSSVVRNRFMRLMPAYFLVALLVFAGKWGAQNFVHVDNPVTGFDDLVKIALFPMQSVSAFLWYIYVLFLVSTIGLALVTLTKARMWPIVVLGVALEFAPNIPILGLGQFFRYFLFFALGGAAAAGWSHYVRWVDRLWITALLLLISVLVIFPQDEHIWPVAALLSIPALHGLCRQTLPGNAVLLLVGSLSFSIYLFNTIAIGVTKAILLKFMTWDGTNFLFLFFPTLMAAGVLVPILLKRHVFHRIPRLDRITS